MQTTTTETTPAETALAQINALDFWARARWGVRGTSSFDDGRTLVLDLGRSTKILVTLDEATDAYVARAFRMLPGCNIRDESVADLHVEQLIPTIESLLAKVA